ncbi:uncharacterized protein [Setaria viridis]|uniref:Uncharacterized protein n=1 Tax=Setaria viridis TaxID=4556 RepID=A0A4U6UG60_SETVI|nr:uncharacterized protein LOC117856156 [Setaria viridis]TKW13093.1 hypothetical protein SEVIR_5G077000v2 [Setaria viridis]
MEEALGHVVPGIIISGIGLWQLFNHIRLFSLDPGTYVAPAWFPAPRVRYLELLVILAGGAYGFVSEMFRSMPFNADGSIPEARLRHHEHAAIYATIVFYAGAAVYLDHSRLLRGRRTLCTLLGALVYAQELFMFHVHSTDHAGVEGQFHWILQVIVAACLATALLGAGFPQSLAVSMVRSVALTFQGVWFMVIGVMWLPGLIANGCSLEDGGHSIRCHSDKSEHHAKAVINLQFGWCLILMALFVVGLYSYVCRRYPPEATYGRLPEAGDPEDLKAGHCMRGFTSLEIEV